MFGAELDPGLVHSSPCFEFVLIHLQRIQTLQVQHRKCLLLNYLCKGQIQFSFFVQRDSYKTTEEEEEEEEDKKVQRRRDGGSLENKLHLSDDANAGTHTHLVGLVAASPTGWRNK